MMVGQPTGEICVPTGWKGVMVEVLLTGTELEETLRGKRGCPEAESGGAVPVRRVAGRKVEFRVGNGTRTEGLVAFKVKNGKRSESGKVTPVGISALPDKERVLFVPLNVGKERNPVVGDRGLPVAFMEGRGRRPEPVVFKIRGGKRPDSEALKLVVKFTVGNGKRPGLGRVKFAEELAVGIGKRPDLGRVEFTVMFMVGEGRKPDLGKVGFAVKLKVGVGRPEIGMIEFAVLLTLGKMPAGIEVEIVVMFKVGKGRPEKGKFGMLVGTRLPGSG